MKKTNAISWFLFGLGSQLQIVASLSFTELFVFIAAPILLLNELPHLRRNGIMPFLYLSFAVVAGCVVASIANQTAPEFVLRGLAVTTLLPCSVVVGHWMLRRDMGGFKWMLIGNSISSILCTFWFQKSVEVSTLAGGEYGASAVEAIVAGPLFWISRLGAIVTAIPQGWYLQCPTLLSIGAPLFLSFFAILTTSSGRSAAASSLSLALLIILGGKKQSRIYRVVCGRFWFLLLLGIVGVFIIKNIYSFGAKKGLLGEDARIKYEMQTKGDSSLKALLLGGRMESFCGLLACADKPIVGFGPWAMDNYGYVSEFLSKYANPEDFADYLIRSESFAIKGVQYKRMIPCHAYLTEFWCWYGISGLIFWLYIMFVLLRYLREDCWVVPQWYMWLAASIPGYFWGIFFSPWMARVGGIMFVVACLMARAVRKGRQPLPIEMAKEIKMVEMR